jgi:hypothetical protein
MTGGGDMPKIPHGWMIAAIAGVACVLVGLVPSVFSVQLPDWLGKFIVLLWTVVPPLWFWADWKRFVVKDAQHDRDWAKHAHDLGRNVWIALTFVLTYLFDVKLPIVGH